MNRPRIGRRCSWYVTERDAQPIAFRLPPRSISQITAEKKFYWEVTVVAPGTAASVGWIDERYGRHAKYPVPGSDAHSYVLCGHAAECGLRHDGTTHGGGGALWKPGDVIGVFCDAEAGTVGFQLNGRDVDGTRSFRYRALPGGGDGGGGGGGDGGKVESQKMIPFVVVEFGAGFPSTSTTSRSSTRRSRSTARRTSSGSRTRAASRPSSRARARRAATLARRRRANHRASRRPCRRAARRRRKMARPTMRPWRGRRRSGGSRPRRRSSPAAIH